jgi:LysM repeat protein
LVPCEVKREAERARGREGAGTRERDGGGGQGDEKLSLSHPLFLSNSPFPKKPKTTNQKNNSKKKDIPVEDLMTLNAARLSGRRSVEAGQKIVLPAGKLSARDREILAGIEPGSEQRGFRGSAFRPYPVRRGETAADIAAKRKVSMAELQRLNPDVNLEKVKADQVIRLPANKFSVREREMLTGTLGIPVEFFSSPAGATTGVLGGVVLAVAAAVAALLFQKRNRGDN